MSRPASSVPGKPLAARPFRIRRTAGAPGIPSAPAREPHEPTHAARFTDSELAWLLATEIVHHLDEVERMSIHVLLGCGDHYDAIVRTLKNARVNEISLSEEAVEMLSQWLQGFARSDGESLLRDLVSGATI